MWNRRRVSWSRRSSRFAQLPYASCVVSTEIPSDEEEIMESAEAQDNLTPSDPESPLENLTDNTGDDEDDHEEKETPTLLPIELHERIVTNAPPLKKRRPSTKDDRLKKAKSKKKKKAELYRSYIKLCVCGVSLIALGVTVYLINPLVLGKHIALAMKEGTFISSMWRAPPLKVFIKVYLFNVTNSESFMSGKENKIRVQEVGPYVYSETLVNSNVTWNANDSVSFTPKRDIQFHREMSVGDPLNDTVISLNVPLLGIASMLHSSSRTLNFALSSLVSVLKSEPFKELTVEESLWGYDDALVKFASRMLPSWINFERFGLLDRMMDEGVNRVTISTKDAKDSPKFTVQYYNGSPKLLQWHNTNNQSKCDQVAGTIEGLLLPQDLTPEMKIIVYRKAFCRPMPLEFVNKTTSDKGFPIYLYTVAKNALDPDNPDNACYCPPGEKCLPKGLSDMSPCYYQIPVAMSFPHFYDAAEEVQRGVEGLSPSAEKHASIVAIQPDTGVPIAMKSRVQLNLVVKKTRYISKVRRFNDMIIPVMWIQVELEELPNFVNQLLSLLLVSGPVIQAGTIGGSVALGFLVLLIANLRYAWKSGLFSDRHTATLLSIRLKKQEEKIIWAGQYTQLIPIQLNTTSATRNR